MPGSPDQIIRPEVLSLSAYHVPPAYGMVKLDAMENPYLLPEELRAEIAHLAANAPINRYPDASAVTLKAALREALAIPAGMEIMLGNGSDEIIQIIAFACARPGATVLSVEPTFVMFRMIAAFAGMTYAGVPLRADFSLDMDAVLDAIARCQPALIFIAYPNNPTGNLFDASAISRIIEAAPGLVVVDEAYQAFANASFMDKLSQYPNLLLMRTLSKLGLAGLRLGLLAGRPEWLIQLEKLRLPYNVGIVTQLIAEKVLQHRDVLLQQAAAIKKDRAVLCEQLSAMNGIESFPTDANFILFRVSEASDVFQKLKKRGVLIKNLNGTHPLLKNCLRVTVGKPDENASFMAALEASLA
ncbi:MULTISPECIES: histidinol-phosphate transaminase [unclassified Nitrosospira]|uniref:histidinol-phosphate transaminase n=1 Tax=unclassified Nitrosospira TaxID=2609267 RepID=UPI000D2FA15E|nr:MULTISPECIES: histidinol-phosphate transaminase [unclassified Nitrosospira]PTR14844.1 histidinol phosphate aminotransferase [Nitrosospira sp. Nsp2]WON73107.1 histidinol-phosphate transaminase [Nitrosospira sp. Is2]